MTGGEPTLRADALDLAEMRAAEAAERMGHAVQALHDAGPDAADLARIAITLQRSLAVFADHIERASETARRAAAQ